jgi:hypothetical protein
MKILSAQVNQTAEQLNRVSQGGKTTLSAQTQAGLKPAAGEEIVLSSTALLNYRAEATRQFAAQSTVTSAVAAVDGKQPETITHNQNSLIESIISRSIGGAEAVTVIRSVSGAESVPLQGEVKLHLGEYVFHEQEQAAAVSFAGSLETASGQSINFNMHLSLQQSQRYEFNRNISIERRALTDPLVLNFGTESVSLTSTIFEFDIDSDGDNESLRQLGTGSGFLALDKNSDGVINDGRELFGSITGNGFSELAAFDQDSNGWIDENDAVFQQLSVMTTNRQGQQELRSLAEVGVGAIYLGSGESPIDLMDSNGMVLGAVKRTGMFLMENGQVKSIQELDLADMKAASQNTQMDSLVIRGEAAPAQPATEEAAAESPVHFGMSIDMMRARFTEIREQQKAFAKSFEETGDSPEVTFIKKLFEGIDKVLQQERGKSQRVSAQYRAFDKS